jgi:chondroitin AC lyase
MAAVDPQHSAEYGAALERDSGKVSNQMAAQPGESKNFFRSDYMVFRQPGFYASVKLCSNRVIGEELVNGENLSGRYLADGATFLYQTGTEYAEIFPLWDWRRVPGVTCATTGAMLAPAGKMETDYAGGVSDGTYGAEGLDYRRDGVAGKKAWFFLDEGVVCLGAGITGTTGSVRTSVDQRLADGPAITPRGPMQPGMRSCKGVPWVLNGNTGYLFPQPLDLWAGTQRQSGAWTKVFSSGSKAEISANVFSIWIDHPSDNASYAYTILPAATVGKLQKYAATPPVEILSNTPETQAVRDDAAGVTEILFYKAGELRTATSTVSADGPCAVIVRKGTIYLADPTQKELQVTLTINGKPRLVKLPQGQMAGKSVPAP